MSSITTGITLQDRLLFRQACYIDGTWVEALGGEEINVDDPATGSTWFRAGTPRAAG